MKFLATIMIFLGYVLVYASVANGGKFATQPWMGILDDAYAHGTSSGGLTGGGSGSGTPATQNQKGTKITGGRGNAPAKPSSGSGTVGTVEKILGFLSGGMFP